jgi:K+-transporting ATPase KdpF subunit
VDHGRHRPVLPGDRALRYRLRSNDGDKAMIENILLTIVSVLVLAYLFIALLRPEVF